MVRHKLTALLAALALAISDDAAAQTTDAEALASLGNKREQALSSVPVCVGIAHTAAEIVVGPPGPTAIMLIVGDGDGCGRRFPPSWLGASSSQTQLVITENSCPAFAAQALKLRPSAPRELQEQPTAVQVGPFTVTDFMGDFELQSPKGRRAAERWTRQTLAVVRPCWDNSGVSGAPNLLGRLYANLALKPGWPN
jgi:hypothetical protein